MQPPLNPGPSRPSLVGFSSLSKLKLGEDFEVLYIDYQTPLLQPDTYSDFTNLLVIRLSQEMLLKVTCLMTYQNIPVKELSTMAGDPCGSRLIHRL